MQAQLICFEQLVEELNPRRHEAQVSDCFWYRSDARWQGQTQYVKAYNRTYTDSNAWESVLVTPLTRPCREHVIRWKEADIVVDK